MGTLACHCNSTRFDGLICLALWRSTSFQENLKVSWKNLEELRSLKTFPVNLEVQRKSGISQAGPAAFLLSVQLIFEPIFFLLGFLRRGVELSEYVASNDEEKYISVLHICRAYLCMHTARTQSSILESTASPDTDLLIFLLYFVSQLVPNLRIYNLTKDLCLRLQNLAARDIFFCPTNQTRDWIVAAVSLKILR